MQRVLDGVEFQLPLGQIIGILGTNGAGKTTLLKIIAGLLSPTAGSVRVHDWDICGERRETQSAAAYCFAEDRSFYWRLTGRQNLEFFGAINDCFGGREAGKLIERVTARLSIEDYLDRPFFQYSSGIRQRFSLARALMIEPRVLLLDEPTRSVDSVESENLWRVIRDDLVRDGGVSVVLVTHQTEEALEVCDRIAILDEGRLKVNIAPADLRLAAAGALGLTLSVDGLRAGEVERLHRVRGVRDVKVSLRDGEQLLEVWGDEAELDLPDLVAATTAAGGRVHGLTRSVPVRVILDELLAKGEGVPLG
ncbi:MAG TPA: ABC transporter ATP-binding protein [Dehalococcoidia bacterium]|nr:ABC transporter ATP-binding protein [Dehalococcoidia bacterium]